MNSIFQISKITFQEVLRDRLLYGLLVVSFVMLGFAIALAQLSFDEQAKITIDFTLMVLNISCVIISIFLGSQLLNREIENKTLLTLLTHPVSRRSFLIGKILGLLFVIFVVFLFFCILLLLQSYYFEFGSFFQLSLSMLGVLLESFIMVSLTIFLSCFLKVYLVVTVSAAIYLVGHWVSSLKTISETTDNELLGVAYLVLKFAIPNLELMNWKSYVVNNFDLGAFYLGQVSLYSLLWTGMFIFFSVLIFSKRDIT